MSQSINKLLKNPLLLIESLGYRGWFNWLNDKAYMKMLYKIRIGKKLNLQNPKTYNEKLQWLKLNDRNPLYSDLVDKYEVKRWVADKIGEEYVVPNYGVWDKFDDIDFDKLPEQFVLKATHNSGGIAIFKGKTNKNIVDRDQNIMDLEITKSKFQKWLKHNAFWGSREWPYKDIKPRIIAEKYIEFEKGKSLKDYKFFCFDGEVKALFIASDRGKNTCFDYFDMDFNMLPIKQHYNNSKILPQKPYNFEIMKEL